MVRKWACLPSVASWTGRWFLHWVCRSPCSIMWSSATKKSLTGLLVRAKHSKTSLTPSSLQPSKWMPACCISPFQSKANLYFTHTVLILPVKGVCFSPRYIKALETMRQLRLEQNNTVKTCQMELQYLKQNKEKAQQIRETVATKEAQLIASKDSVQQIENQIDPLEVGWQCVCIFILKV